MKRIAVFAGVVVFLAVGFVGGYGYGRWYGPKSPEATGEAAMHNGRKVLYWVDGMHPWVKSDKPGLCPICNMELTPVYADEAAGTEPKGEVLYYTDPQAPDYRADVPGLNPETGNDLVPVYADSPAVQPPGTVQISSAKQQLIGVVFGKPQRGTHEERLRAAGKVTLDERRIARVNSKVSGWVEKVFVDFTGDVVKQGQPLLTIYSPELLASQREYLLAMEAAERMAKSSLPSAQEHNQAMLAAARRRLQLFDLTAAQIEALERTREPQKSVTLYAPTAGYVMERNAFPNQRVMPESSLYTLADLSRVWVMAEVFEHEAGNIRPGQHATLQFPYEPQRQLHGRVSYIQPGLDPTTRTLQVRIEVPNPGLRLKPEMYLDVYFAQGGGEVLTVPASALIDTGERQVVYVHRGNGYMEPRRVRVGQRFGDAVEILEGLTLEDEIVVSGNFLIDSESRLHAGSGQSNGPQGQTPPADMKPPAGHQHH